MRGNFDGSRASLEEALELAYSRPATMALDQALRDELVRAYLGLAMTYSRQGQNERSEATMEAYLRFFPDREISRAKYGPEPADLAKRALAQLASKTRATLNIEVDDPAAVIFLDERYLAVNKATVTDLYPGRHRIFVRGTSAGRVHQVTLTPGGEVTVHLSMALDQALRTDRRMNALIFPDIAARLREEGPGASAIGTALGVASTIVVGIRPFEGHRSIVGTVIRTDNGRTLRAAAVVLEPNPPEGDAVRALGRFLALGGTPDPALKMVGGDENAARKGALTTTTAEVGRTRPYRIWKFIALGAGVALVGAGSYWIAINHNKACGRPTCINEYTTATQGYISAGVGVVAIGLGVVLWIKDHPSGAQRRRDSTARVDLAPIRGGAALSWTRGF